MSSVLTQCCHLFGKVRPKPAKQTAIGQQVERGVAANGVEGEGVDGRWEASHVANLPFSVGGHGCEVSVSQGGWEPDVITL